MKIVANFVKVIICEYFNAIQEGENNGYTINKNELVINLTSTIMSDMVELLSDMRKEYMGIKDNDTATHILTTMQCIIDKFEMLYEITQKYGGKWSGDYWAEIRDLGMELIGDIIIANYKKLEPAEFAKRILEKGAKACTKSIVETAVRLKDDMLNTAESLAEACIATNKDYENDNQVSFHAACMYNAFTVSENHLTSLRALHMLLECSSQNESFTDILKNPDLVSAKEIIEALDHIRIQYEMDAVGCKHYVELMILCQRNPQFYKDLKNQIQETTWESLITLEKARADYNTIIAFKNKLDFGWKEEYRELAQ